MDFSQIAWRGFVTKEGDVIAWPMLLADHNDFLSQLYRNDEDFAARWRQWSPSSKPDVDPGASELAERIIEAWLRCDYDRLLRLKHLAGRNGV